VQTFVVGQPDKPESIQKHLQVLNFQFSDPRLFFRPGPNVIKLFCPQFINFRTKLVFVPCKLFQPSQTLA